MLTSARSRFLVGWIAVAAGFCASLTYAVSTTYEFDAVFDRTSGGANFSWQLRGPFSGSFTVDLETPTSDSDPSGQVGIYPVVEDQSFTSGQGSITDLINGTLGSYSFSEDGGDVVIVDSAFDRFSVRSVIPTAERPVRGFWSLSSIQFTAQRNDGSILMTDALPTVLLLDTLLSASDALIVSLGFLHTSGVGTSDILYTVSSVTRVSSSAPEPSSAVLLAVGLVLGARRIRRRSPRSRSAAR